MTFTLIESLRLKQERKEFAPTTQMQPNGWRICGERFTHLPESNRFLLASQVVRARNMRLLCVFLLQERFLGISVTKCSFASFGFYTDWN